MGMFSSNNNRTRDTAAPLPPAPREGHPAGSTGAKRGMFSVIGPDVTVTGNIKASADLHIDGRVDGDVDCGALVQGADSRIVGTVIAAEARIGGTVEGKVSVRQLTVERSAKIHGDVEYETIAIENGAHIDGRLKHTARREEAPAVEPMRLVSDSEGVAA